MHRDLPAGAPEVDVKINGKPFRAILDSGSAVSLVQSHLLSPRMEYKTFLPITCVHGDTRQVPARRVTISAVPGTWSVEVGVVKDLPVPVLIGRDWPGFDRLLATTTQPASPRRERRRRKPRKGPRQRPVLLASDSGRDGESPSQNPNLFYYVFQQVTGVGSFGKEQHEDDRLKHCWTEVRIIEGKEAWPSSSPAFRRPKRPALLCRSAKGGGKIIVGGAPHKDGDRTGVGAFPSLGRAPRSHEYHPTDPRPLPLAGIGS